VVIIDRRLGGIVPYQMIFPTADIVRQVTEAC